MFATEFCSAKILLEDKTGKLKTGLSGVPWERPMSRSGRMQADDGDDECKTAITIIITGKRLYSRIKQIFLINTIYFDNDSVPNGLVGTTHHNIFFPNQT